MKTIATLLLLLTFGFTAHAKQKTKQGKGQGQAKQLDEAQVQKIKTMSIQNIDKRITILNTTKTCIQKATDAKTLQQCRKTQKQSMMALMKENGMNKHEMKKKMKHKK